MLPKTRLPALVQVTVIAPTFDTATKCPIVVFGERGDRSDELASQDGNMRPLVLALVCALSVIGCGDDDGFSGLPSPVATASPTPTTTPMPAHAHIVLGSSEMGGGEIVADFDFENEGAELNEMTCEGGSGPECNGGTIIYSGVSPAFLAAEEHGHGGALHPLNSGTQVILELVSVDPGVQIRFEDMVLNRQGQRLLLGTAPFHHHVTWQLVLPASTCPHESVHTASLRFLDSSNRYRPSQVYTIRLNVVENGHHHEVP